MSPLAADGAWILFLDLTISMFVMNKDNHSNPQKLSLFVLMKQKRVGSPGFQPVLDRLISVLLQSW
jgi:hypothetical protein